jgi:hypothetical protein
MRAPWEQREDESATAFAWFARYRSLPPEERSLARLISDATGAASRTDGAPKVPQLSQLKRWSRRYDWQARTRAWDGAIDQRRQSAMLDAAVSASERHALQARLHIRAMTLPAVVLAERMRTSEGDAAVRGELADMPADRLLELAERCGRGLDRMLQAERDALGFRFQVVTAEATEKAAAARAAAMTGEPDDGDLVAQMDRLAAVYAAMEEAGQPLPPIEWRPEDRPDDA